MTVTAAPTRSDLLPPRSLTLRGVAVHDLSEKLVIDTVVDAVDDRRGGWIITLNLQHLHRCEHDPEYRAIVDEADLVVVDGMPLVWAARLQGTPVPQRVAGSTLVVSLASVASRREQSIYLLGGDPGTAVSAAEELQRRFSSLEIAGTFCPPLGFEHDAEQLDIIRTELMTTAPDIVYVGLGSPKQEKLIRVLREDLPATWWIGVGISFSFLSGDIQRAPLWIQNAGLEWAHRLMQEPRRLFRRYVVEGIPFGARLLWDAWRGRGDGDLLYAETARDVETSMDVEVR